MSRKGYHLLTSDILNSDPDEDERVSSANSPNGWSEVEENLNIFAENVENNSSKNENFIELRSRNSFGGGSKATMDSSAASSTTSRTKTGNGNHSSNNGVVLLERRVRKDDTLQKISLQFSIPIAELKRVNGFIADTDLFAREIIKIPVKKYSYNHALIMAELDGAEVAPPTETVPTRSAAAAAIIVPSNVTSVSTTASTEPARAERLLQTVDANILKAQRQLEQCQQSSDVFNANNGGDHDHMLELHRQNRLARDAQFGIGWSKRHIRNLLAVTLLLFILVGIPVIYIIYKFGGQSNGGHHGHQH